MLFTKSGDCIGGIASLYGGPAYHPAIGVVDDLTTTYRKGLFAGSTYYNSDYRYFQAKKSSDGLTVYWYINADAKSQFNSSGAYYRYIVIA